MRDAFLSEPAAAAIMLEAAVRAAYGKPGGTFPGAAFPGAAGASTRAAVASPAAAAYGCGYLQDAILKLCAFVVLENPHDDNDVRPALLMDFENADNRSMLHAVQQAVRPGRSGARSVAAYTAAAGAAAEAGAAVAQQERLQLLLWVVSLLGSSVKVMARGQQQQQSVLGWGRVAYRCGRIAELCLELAGYEQALVDQREKSTEVAADDIIGDLDAWCKMEGVDLLSDTSMDVVAAMLVQHPYAQQLVRTNLGGLHALLRQCVEAPSLAADQAAESAGVEVRDVVAGASAAAAAKAVAAAAAAALAAAAPAEPSAPPEHVLLAALLCDVLSEGDVTAAAPTRAACRCVR
jgi:hypothetical protein